MGRDVNGRRRNRFSQSHCETAVLPDLHWAANPFLNQCNKMKLISQIFDVRHRASIPACTWMHFFPGERVSNTLLSWYYPSICNHTWNYCFCVFVFVFLQFWIHNAVSSLSILSVGAPSPNDCAALSSVRDWFQHKPQKMSFRSKSPMLFFLSRGWRGKF